MPTKILEFARSALVKPVIVNVGRAGAANLDVIQHIEFVKSEDKFMKLLEALQETEPPVLIFAENKKDVDDIYEFLLLKEVEAVSIHGSKTQEEREFAIRSFKDRRKDVLVATDVASKGLDFASIQHVINFDMPKEIEDYVHRIGRTGRSGKTGLATTFVNSSTSETVLSDLKLLLVEAKQKIPPFMTLIGDGLSGALRAGGKNSGTGFTFCGGLGHTISECPKLKMQQKKERDSISGKMMRDGGF